MYTHLIDAFDTTAKGVIYTYYICPNSENMILTPKYLSVPPLGARPSLTHAEVFNA